MGRKPRIRPYDPDNQPLADSNGGELHHRLKYLRLAAGLNADQVSEITGFPKTTLSRMENGRVTPRISTLEKLASALGCRLEIRVTPIGPPRRLDYRKINRAGRVVRSPKAKTLGEVQALAGLLEQIAPTTHCQREGAVRHTGTSVKYARRSRWGEKFPDAEPNE